MSLPQELFRSASILQEIGLYKAAKWSAEALNTISDFSGPLEVPTDSRERVPFLLAKAYFDCREYDRAANALKACATPRCVYLRSYAQFLSCEKRSQEEFHELLGEKKVEAENKGLQNVLKEVSVYLKSQLIVSLSRSYFEKLKSETRGSNAANFETHGVNATNSEANIDPIFASVAAARAACDANNCGPNDTVYVSLLHHLVGIIYLKQKNVQFAQKHFLNSVSLYQFNWECWNDLVATCKTLDEGVGLIADVSSSSTSTVMTKLFAVVVCREFFQYNPSLFQQIDELMVQLPNFAFLKAQKALCCYQSLNYPLAESLFDEMLTADPYNLDHMDTYSNILYVMENKAKLSFLSQLATSIDKFRPETCCIVANFYSLKFEHEKAIMYYKRALNLNKNYLSAWTLMGHEFVELKNSHAAIESYRRAVDINQKDFRAWYGLGQAYEVLDMFLYSLYYYERACELKPLDKRIWTALGNCFEKLGKYEDSIKAYKKIPTVNVDDDDVTFVFYKLGTLYEALKDMDNAEVYMKKCFNEENSTGVVTEKSSKARLWLAKRELEKGNYEGAYEYAKDFNSGTSQEIEEARAIVRKATTRHEVAGTGW